MDVNTEYSFSRFDDVVTDDGFAHPIGRKLRSFDVDGVEPHDYPGVVAFLKALKLSDLSTGEIRVFLMLRDNPDPKGYTTRYIARWLGMSGLRVRMCLHALKRKGYAKPNSITEQDARGRGSRGWVVERSNAWADDDTLFWEFGYLM